MGFEISGHARNTPSRLAGPILLTNSSFTSFAPCSTLSKPFKNAIQRVHTRGKVRCLGVPPLCRVRGCGPVCASVAANWSPRDCARRQLHVAGGPRLGLRSLWLTLSARRARQQGQG